MTGKDGLQVDQLEGYYDEETWSKGLSREETLERQIRLIAFYYSKGMWNEFQYSLKILLPLLPAGVREMFEPETHATDEKGIEIHYKQFTDINVLLESDTNLIWKKKFVKTYE